VGRHATSAGEVDVMANRSVPLEVEIRRRIEGGGPIAVAPYMELCLTHPERGYYTTGNPLGAQGDFITAPEISQMFGELVGLWAAAVWRAMGSPASLNLVELGPGRGTMMSDVLRVAKVMPGFRAAIALHLIEISPVLERLQRQALSFADVPMSWHRSIEEVPDGPLILLANEFFDALPIHQAVMCADGWHQRVVKIGQDDAFHFDTEPDPLPLFDKLLPRSLGAAQIGDIFEWRADNIALEIGRRVVRFGGAALIVDYGHVESAIGDTLQAVGKHDVAEPLRTPGEVDLTAHVDFQALAQAAEGMGARVHGPVPQSALLRALGIEERAAALKASAPPDYAATIQAALERLTDETRTGMGRLFKALAVSDPKLDALPGFEA
jgi:NADH dehydrogenase [ubiquinone] 1 alpha subcomplex assembly factor 7